MSDVRIEADADGSRFWVQSETEAETHRVLAHGELDLAGVPTIERAITQAEESAAARIDLDLNAVTFIDSSGIQFLLRTCTRLKTAGDRLRITRPSAVVLAVIDLSGIGALLPLQE